jgi:Flp pilus assembly protein TadG
MDKRSEHRPAESGQALLFVTLSLPVVLGLVGLVVDAGWAYYRREACKAAADGAALAGATVAYNASNTTCGSGVTCQSNTACPSNPTSTTDPVQVACQYAIQNGFTNGSNRRTVTIAANTTSSPVSGTSPAYWVAATVSEQLPLTFLAVLGSQWATVSVKSIAGAFPGTGGCIYILAHTNEKDAFTLTNGTLTTTCSIYDDSNNSEAMKIPNGTINLNSSTADLKVNGGENLGGGTITPAGNNYANDGTREGDPMSGETAPTPSLPCTADPGSGSGGTIQPGTYCQISINNNSWTLASGVFIITSGNFTINNGTLNSAAGGVTIYFPPTSPGVLNVNGGTTNISAIQTGGTSGIVVWKDGTTASTTNWTNGTLNISGVIYMPYTALNYTNGSASAAQTFIVNTLNMTNGSITKAAASPFLSTSNGAFLMQ